MSMQDTINEIYRMRHEAYDRERQELLDVLLELLKTQSKDLKNRGQL